MVERFDGRSRQFQELSRTHCPEPIAPALRKVRERIAGGRQRDRALVEIDFLHRVARTDGAPDQSILTPSGRSCYTAQEEAGRRVAFSFVGRAFMGGRQFRRAVKRSGFWKDARA
jgi:hypothetical protein